MTDPTPTRDEAGDFLCRLRTANIRRDAEYRAKTQGEPLPLLFRTTEFAGEVGELLNVVKKIERERLGWAGKRADWQMLLEEFGGVVATLDLLAMMLDVDLAAATADEFNAVSDRLSLKTKLASAPAPASGGVDAGAWPEPKVRNPDIPAPTGVPYIDSLIDQLLDAQQDINLAANERMDQSLCDASTLIEEVERALRIAASLSPAATPVSEAGGERMEVYDIHPAAPVWLLPSQRNIWSQGYRAGFSSQITMGRGLVDVTRIEHEGRSGILFRPRDQHIPVGDEGDLQPGEYWPVTGDVVIWIENVAGAQVIRDYLSSFLPVSEAEGERPPLKMLVDRDQLRTMIEQSPDEECKAGVLHPEAGDEPARELWDIESLAQWLHDETEHQESYPGCQWPEHPDDNGNRDGGFIKIVPKHAQAYFRQMAARCFGVRPFSDEYFRALKGEPAALAKPASSPAGGDVSLDEITMMVRYLRAADDHMIASGVRYTGTPLSNVLGVIRDAIAILERLSQSTSAGRVGE